MMQDSFHLHDTSSVLVFDVTAHIRFSTSGVVAKRALEGFYPVVFVHMRLHVHIPIGAVFA